MIRQKKYSLLRQYTYTPRLKDQEELQFNQKRFVRNDKEKRFVIDKEKRLSLTRKIVCHFERSALGNGIFSCVRSEVRNLRDGEYHSLQKPF